MAQENGKDRCVQAVRELSQAFALAVPHEDALRIRDDVAFFQAVQSVLAKRTTADARPEEELDHAVRQIISRAVASEGVIDIFAAAGLEKPDISILSDEFLAEVRGMPQRNLAWETPLTFAYKCYPLRTVWRKPTFYYFSPPPWQVTQGFVRIEPVTMDIATRKRMFVEDLKAFHDGHAAFFDTRELYLLRNLSRSRGVGFFEAGNFHPDFILWLLTEGQQRIIFVDPKGIRSLGPNDPKIQFYETIKEIEQRLGDPAVCLQSFIVSNTPSTTMRMLWNMKKIEMQRRHVLFQ